MRMIKRKEISNTDFLNIKQTVIIEHTLFNQAQGSSPLVPQNIQDNTPAPPQKWRMETPGLGVSRPKYLRKYWIFWRGRGKSLPQGGGGGITMDIF